MAARKPPAVRAKEAPEIERRMKLKGFNPKSLSLAAELGETYVGDLLRGRSLNPKTSELSKLAERLECTVDDLRDAPAAQKGQILSINEGQSEGRDLVWSAPIREIDVYAEMGPEGGMVDQAVTVGIWQVPAEWIRTEIRTPDPRSMRILTIEGDSMLGTLNPGDKVLIDLSRRRPSPPGLFMIWDGVAQVPRRLEFIDGSQPPRIRVISDNPRYLTYESAVEATNIVGRVMGRWQRMG